MIETIAHVFPNQYAFLGFWFIMVAGLISCLYLLLNSKQTTKLITLAVDYVDSRKKRSALIMDMVGDLNAKLKTTIDENHALKNHIDKLESELTIISTRLSNYESAEQIKG